MGQHRPGARPCPASAAGHRYNRRDRMGPVHPRTGSVVDLCSGMGHERSKFKMVLERANGPGYGAAKQPQRKAAASILMRSKYNVRYGVQNMVLAAAGAIQAFAIALALGTAPLAAQV